MMATLIELPTPEKYAAMAKRFQDWTLDASSLQDNCQRIADDLNRDGRMFRDHLGRARPVQPNDVLQTSKAVVVELGAVVRSHRDYMKAGEPS